MQRLCRFWLFVVSWLFLATVGSADVRILWDVSQSMVANDPNNNRNAALIRLVDELPEGDRAAIWTFGQFVNLLAPHEPVNNNWRSQARDQIRGVQSVALRTNMGAVFEQAAYDFNFSSYRGPIDVILVTDGQVDISPNPEVNAVERARILSTVIPRYRAANARIHTIAISSQADQSLLRQISQLTGGQFYAINNADGLASSLFAVNQSRQPSGVATVVTAQQATSEEVLQSQFSVVDAVRELTVVVSHQRGAIELRRPNGDTTSAVNPGTDRWQVGPGYSQITINNADVGNWQILGELSGLDNVQVFRDLRLVWQEPAMMTVANGSTVNLTAALVDRDNNVVRDFAERIGQIELTVNGQPIAASVDAGRIRARLLPRANNESIELSLTIDVGTFARSISGQLRYADAFNSELLLTDIAYEWRIYPNQNLLGDARLQLQATISHQGQQTTEPLLETEFGYWRWQLLFDQPVGSYDVELSGTSDDAGRITEVPKRMITLTLPVDPSLASARTPGAVQTTEPELAIPDLSLLEPELVVPEPDDNWNEQPVSEPRGESRSLLTYLLLSLPGIAILAGAYLFYRRLESKSKASSSEDEMLLGGDEFAGLDDIDNIGLDADLDIGSVSEDDDMEPPIIDDEYDEDLPTPAATEAPKANMDDLLEQVGSASDDDYDATMDIGESDDEELFDISSIDDDLADLDLALDGDDPFADDIDEKK